MKNVRAFHLLVSAATVFSLGAAVYRSPSEDRELPNRIPEPAPYVTAEAESVPPPFEDFWQQLDHPAQCQTCHTRVFNEWNGSMMANAWRDPVWRAAFLLSARETSTFGDCETPAPPDGTARAHHNPFALPAQCASTFDIGTAHHRLARPGSLVDSMCSRCHMPTNYVDNVPLRNVRVDRPSGAEHGSVDPNFNPTASDGTGLAFATADAQRRNTDSGKTGVACMVCHSLVATRETPFHNYVPSSDDGYAPAPDARPRAVTLAPDRRDQLEVPDRSAATLGYSIGGGAFRLSPHAIGTPDRVGPLTIDTHAGTTDRYLSSVFKRPLPYEQMDPSKHFGSRQTLTTRAEFCSACHDVTNPLTVKNTAGRWVGGFPIERTYAEWAGSRYADRPGNRNFDPAFKRDCQTCHMQQDYGRPATARTLYEAGEPKPPLVDSVANGAPPRTYFSHHFIGGNSYVPRLIGADTGEAGDVEPYPELSAFSFSSSDEKSLYANAYWRHAERRGAATQHARLAWDRLRNAVDVAIASAPQAAAGGRVPLRISVTNSGSGHNFPTGFPEGRVAWLAVRAADLATGRRLEIYDSVWNRTSRGVGDFTREDTIDPNFPGCNWKIPAGSPDPFAYQFKAVASLGDGCPTLDLVYAAPLNLVTNARGLPIDRNGVAIGRENPRAVPQFRDLNGNGDLYDDAFLRDTRLRPLPNRGAMLALDRYAVVIPPGTRGPVAVTAAVYYQSVEAVVAKKFLGNLADTDTDFVLEPCVLDGPCDGRVPSTEPAVVEGAPPVPVSVHSATIQIDGSATDRQPPRIGALYPPPGATGVYQDVVVKVSFSMPVRDLTTNTFTLEDSRGARVPASIAQVGDGTWALFPDAVFLAGGETYTARVSHGICGDAGPCTPDDVVWRFTVSPTRGAGTGDTRIPSGFPAARAAEARPALMVRSIAASAVAGAIEALFSQPVMNVTPVTFVVRRAAAGACAASTPKIAGHLTSDDAGDRWTFKPEHPLEDGEYCVAIAPDVYDLAGRNLGTLVNATVIARRR
jgi:Big-like domain-containing protein